eukprot:CAMPEP_0205798934 /NCGR_PEP_ID=MMETSP0205-20121125/33_1 /ASSEMBLY_ACC=CAM_ASM_000278 /TAXON_ID=36767 /ORGANISM="Euplotes focardii, Strain TN1" /LENGTH=170 /DNA_ID=CAMNT_0053059399 /DNA_START=219 /DNA_END=731 /DNA_ORIENTATION=+
MVDSENSLKYDKVWRINFMGVSLEALIHIDLIVGWSVNPGSSDLGSYEVTYTPFIWGTVFGRANATTWPLNGYTRGGVQFVHAYAPIAVTLYTTGRVCFDAFYVVNPIHVGNQFGLSLRGCQAEIIDELATSTPLNFACDYNDPIDVQFIDSNITSTYTNTIVGETCIGF